MLNIRVTGYAKISKIWMASIQICERSALTYPMFYRIGNLSIKKGYQIQDEKRLLTKEEAYEQISHSASLFKAISSMLRRLICNHSRERD
jgi:hypothetical protein